jgi:hypothetical protein
MNSTHHPITPHRCDEDGRRRVRTKCLKCGESIILDFGRMSDSEIIEKIRYFRRYGAHCPGWHVELDMTWCWQLDLVEAAIRTSAVNAA